MEQKKPSYDPAWQDKYRGMLATPDAAVARIRAGQRVFIGTGCAQPQTLVNALSARSAEINDTELVHFLTVGEAPYAAPALTQSFRVNSFFVADNVRPLIQEGLGDYTPILLSDIPKLFSSGELPLDAALIQVTPPDEHGLCSLGVSVDIVRSAAENARLVIAEVNPLMPRTHGDNAIDVNDLDILVPVEHPIAELTFPPPDETGRRIGEHVASLVEDESTVEFGIGAIPQSVMPFLKGKKDLGVHTEMFTDPIMELIASGAVTGARKSVERGRVVASFCMGTRKLYDFIDGNPAFAFHPSEYVNDPTVIAQQHKQVAINEALEVDLTGQVCADSVGTRFHGGIGGQPDFNRGAARSAGGKVIVALPSTTRDGAASSIVCRLTPGAGVVTTRGDVHYVVTEFGAAYLHGKSVHERALALITVSHPKFRGQLLKEAIEARYVRAELADVEGRVVVSPPAIRTSMLLADGTTVNFRSIRPTDEPNVRDLFYALSQETIYYRFMSHLRRIPRQEIRNFVFIDHRSDAAVVATLPEAYGEEIVAIGRYYLNAKTNMAEVAFVVRDRWQRHGIGTFLFRHLANTAKRSGIRGFTAEVLKENLAMQRVFDDSEFKVTKAPARDVFSYTLEFQ